jgi:uncharacterized protein
VAERVVAVVWELPGEGAEHCTLERTDGGFRLTGTAVVAEQGAPYLVGYAVEADAEWRTRSTVVRCNGSRLELAADAAGGWSLPALEGCLDVDLGFTPSTNTLPIRRLGLEIGDAADIDAAWLRFPALKFERLSQRYERLAEDRYRYSSPGFQADLVVDAHGLVVEYEGFWRAIACA